MKNVEPKKGGVLFIGGNAQTLISKDVIVGTREAEDQRMREDGANKESHLTPQTIRLASNAFCILMFNTGSSITFIHQPIYHTATAIESP